VGYVNELRQIVGSKPIIVVGATVLVYDNQGRILLQHRSDTGTWGLPGGAMEPGETLEETARRELYEETGLEAHTFKLLGIFSGREFFFEYPNGDQIHTVIVLYEATDVVGHPKVYDEESLDLQYFSPDDLPKLESRAGELLKRLNEVRNTQ